MTGLSECLMSAPNSFLIAARAFGDRAEAARYEPEGDLVSRREQPCSDRIGQLTLTEPASHIPKLDLELQIIPCGQPQLQAGRPLVDALVVERCR